MSPTNTFILLLILRTISADRVHIRIQPLSVSIMRNYGYHEAIDAFDDNLETACHSTGDELIHWLQAQYLGVICPNKIDIVNGKDNSNGFWLDGAKMYILNSTESGKKRSLCSLKQFYHRWSCLRDT